MGILSRDKCKHLSLSTLACQKCKHITFVAIMGITLNDLALIQIMNLLRYEQKGDPAINVETTYVYVC